MSRQEQRHTTKLGGSTLSTSSIVYPPQQRGENDRPARTAADLGFFALVLLSAIGTCLAGGDILFHHVAKIYNNNNNQQHFTVSAELLGLLSVELLFSVSLFVALGDYARALDKRAFVHRFATLAMWGFLTTWMGSKFLVARGVPTISSVWEDPSLLAAPILLATVWCSRPGKSSKGLSQEPQNEAHADRYSLMVV